MSPTATALELQDKTGTLAIGESRLVHRHFSWQSTKSAATWVKISCDAFGKDLAANVVGFFGVLVTVPLTTIAVPFDVVAYPFRWNREVQIRATGQAVDGNGSPFRRSKFSVVTYAKYPESDIFSFPLYHRTVSGETDEQGKLNSGFGVSFGPNRAVGVDIQKEGGGSIQHYWLAKRGRSIQVITNEFPNSWQLRGIQGAP